MMYSRTVHPMRPTEALHVVMMWPVATVETVATLSEVAEALAADEIGALCVVENGALAGIVSERDVVAHLAAGADPEHLTAGEVMTPDVVTVGPDATILEAARLMQDSQVRHLPVLDEGQIAGIVSMRDLFAVLADAADEDIDVVYVPSGTRVVLRAD
ncbi:MAG: CBS domain-containing protein [Nocardioides sp.]